MMLRRLFRRRRDPWTDPTLPRQCTATLDASECVREAHGDYGHCDSHGHQWDAPRPVHVTCREHAQRGNWRRVCAYCHQQLGYWPGPATRALLDPWTDPTLPPRCAETHPQWGTQCVKESSEHAEHCDYLGAQWYGGWCCHD